MFSPGSSRLTIETKTTTNPNTTLILKRSHLLGPTHMKRKCPPCPDSSPKRSPSSSNLGPERSFPFADLAMDGLRDCFGIPGWLVTRKDRPLEPQPPTDLTRIPPVTLQRPPSASCPIPSRRHVKRPFPKRGIHHSLMVLDNALQILAKMRQPKEPYHQLLHPPVLQHLRNVPRCRLWGSERISQM